MNMFINFFIIMGTIITKLTNTIYEWVDNIPFKYFLHNLITILLIIWMLYLVFIDYPITLII